MSRFFKKRSDKVLLKDRTEGTSNEISLSVLDATKDALDDESSGRDKSLPPKSRLGVIRLFTLSGRRKHVATPKKDKAILLEEDLRQGEQIPPSASSGQKEQSDGGKHVRVEPATPLAIETETTWAPPMEEVSRRKRGRLRGKLIAGVIGGVVGAVLIGLGVWAAVSFFSHQETLRGHLEEVIETIDQADTAIMKLDELVAAQTSLEDGGDAEEMIRSYDELKAALGSSDQSLEEAKSSVESFKEEIVDGRDLEVANEAISAIEARQAMIETGEHILDEALPLRRAKELSAAGWQAILDGDEQARAAATLIAETTADNAHASIEGSQKAIASFNSARDDFASASPYAPMIDFAPFDSYINLRIEALNAAIASDEAYLERDRVVAEENNARYNDLDGQAAAAAAALGGDPSVQIGNYLVELLTPEISAYGQQRQQAGEADNLLRTYLERRS